MFDFSWSQIMLIGVVALILIGPKDLPIALRAISNLVKKARAMAAEFHTHVDDLMKDADLKGVRDSSRASATSTSGRKSRKPSTLTARSAIPSIPIRSTRPRAPRHPRSPIRPWSRC